MMCQKNEARVKRLEEIEKNIPLNKNDVLGFNLGLMDGIKGGAANERAAFLEWLIAFCCCFHYKEKYYTEACSVCRKIKELEGAGQ